MPGADGDAWPFEVVTTDLEFPEGPVVLPDGDVLVVEVRGGRLTRVAPDGTKRVVADLGGGPNGAAIGPDGAGYVVNNGGFAWMQLPDFWIPVGPDGGNEPEGFTGGWVDRVDLGTGEVRRLYNECDGVPFAGPNDIVFDREGGFWFTDFGKVRARTMDRGSLLYGYPDGSGVRRVADHLIGPNGVGLSPDGKHVYVAETYTGRVLRWDVTGPGEVAGHQSVVASSAEHFDSLAIEDDGTVVVAAIRGLFVLRPDGSSSVMPLPDFMITNVCFGGADRRTAYITMSASGRLVRGDWPRPGLALAW
jgi:gluconolactonase